ncbi:hypothetical protein GCM10018775_80250 [Streptomyces umbrinus]|nr:hypothetical protein GCM10018775_80250 [Streptomyces umbrinus]
MTIENATANRSAASRSRAIGQRRRGGPQAGGGEGLCQWIAEQRVLPLGLQCPHPGHPHRRGPHSRRLHPLLLISHRASLEDQAQGAW